jgi:hypothetical protein
MKLLISSTISRAPLGMIGPIDFNYEACAGRQKIRNESPDWHLATKGNAELFS